MNKRGISEVTVGILIFVVSIGILYGLIWYLPHFAIGWDTGVMTGTIIGYDTNLFGTKSIYVLEDRTIFGENGMSQSQITLCSDFDDTEIHSIVEQSINKKAVIEYKERRVGYYPFKYCHESPITKISLVEVKQ
jgi:hypothetical protein